jgi:crotonobetaine/carnitine-CoA ligase
MEKTMHKIDLANTELRTLPALLKIQSELNGDTAFLLTDSEQLSFSETQQKCLSLATGLANLGISKGDHVGVFLSNCPEMVLVAIAANMLGAIWVPICTDYKGNWLSDTISRSRPKLLITESSLAERISDDCLVENNCALILTDKITKQGQMTFESLLNNQPWQVNYQDIDYGDTSAVVWTSGTTGKSKGVLVSHNGWIRPIEQGSSIFYQSVEGDVIFNVLPMYHAGAWTTSILRALIEGLGVVLEKRFSVQNFWQRINKFKATQSFTLGAMHMFLWNAPKQDNDAQNTLRTLQAVPINKALIEPFEKRFGLSIAGSGLGQSECMLIATQAGASLPIADNSIGFARPDTELGIFDDQDQRLSDGSVGEIRIKPLQAHIVCNGYLDDSVASANAWKGEWFCTGDLGYRDSNGAYFFSDRKKDAVRFAGRNISTMEVEGVLRQYPDVIDVAAYGIPSTESDSEDELKIDLVLRPDADVTHEQVAQFINDNAPYYFVPRFMEFVTQLPYTPTNKVQKYLLREKPITEAAWDLRSSNFKVSR